jgi:uncharacterized protein YoxC
MEQSVNVIAYVIAITGIVAGAARWLITKYFDLHKELEGYKERAVKSQVERIKTETEELRKHIGLLRTDILEHSKVVARHETKLGGLETKITQMEDIIRPFSQALARKRARELEAQAMETMGATKIVAKKGK